MAGAVFFICAAACSYRSGERELKVPFIKSGPVSGYDTIKITYAGDVSFLENVFSPLVEYSADAELVSGVASKFEWAGPEARFHFLRDLRAADGQLIDAYDAEFTFKRIFSARDGKYAFLAEMLCGRRTLAKAGDSCPGLEVRNGGALLAMKFSEKKTFLFPMLASAYFGIVPRRSVNPATLELKDYRNTSGPYYVAAERPDGTVELRANKAHYRYSTAMPQKVSLVPLKEFGNEHILGQLASGKADYLLYDVVRYPDAKISFAAKNGGFRLHQTYPMRGVFAIFTRRGMRRLTLQERLFIGQRLRESFRRLHPGYEVPDQIFTMEGGLSLEQRGRLKSMMAEVPASGTVGKKVVAWRLFNYFFEEQAEIKKWLPGVTSFGSSRLPGPASSGEGALPEPDFYIAGSDIALQEDVGLLSYFLELEFFDLEKGEKADWLKRYISAPDKKTRMEMLRELQYRTLVRGAVVPLSIHPYAALVSADWDFKLPKNNTSNPAWRLRAR